MGLQVPRGFHPEEAQEADIWTHRASLGEVAGVIGYIKGKSAISIARNLMGKARNFTGENFWDRGYFVSTVCLNEDTVRQYVREQDKEDARLEQLSLAFVQESPPSGGS